MVIVMIFLVFLFVTAPFIVFIKRTEFKIFNSEVFTEYNYIPVRMSLIYISGMVLPILYIGSALAYFKEVYLALPITLSVSIAVLYYISKHIEEKTNKETAIKSTSIVFLYGIAIWAIPVMLYSYCSDSKLSTKEKKQKWYCRQYWI